MMSMKTLSIAAALVAGTLGFANKADAQVIVGGTYYPSYSYPSYSYPTYAQPSYYQSGTVYSSGYTPYYDGSSGVVVSGYSTPMYGSSYYGNGYYGSPYSSGYSPYGYGTGSNYYNGYTPGFNNVISTPTYGVGTRGVNLFGRRAVRW